MYHCKERRNKKAVWKTDQKSSVVQDLRFLKKVKNALYLSSFLEESEEYFIFIFVS